MATWDYEKPSRQKRREKRGWKRPRKKQLDQCGVRWQSLSPVLNTPLEAVSAPVSLRGFFASIGFFLWSGSAQLYNSLRAKSASGLLAVLKYPTAPQQGELSTNLEGGHHGC